MRMKRDKQGKFLPRLGSVIDNVAQPKQAAKSESNGLFWVLGGVVVLGFAYKAFSAGYGLYDFTKSYSIGYESIGFDVNASGIKFAIKPVLDNATPTALSISQPIVYFGINDTEVSRSAPRTGQSAIINIKANDRTPLGLFEATIAWTSLLPYAPAILSGFWGIIKNFQKIKSEYESAKKEIENNYVMSVDERAIQLKKLSKGFIGKFSQIFEKIGIKFQYRTSMYFQGVKLENGWETLAG